MVSRQRNDGTPLREIVPGPGAVFSGSSTCSIASPFYRKQKPVIFLQWIHTRNRKSEKSARSDRRSRIYPARWRHGRDENARRRSKRSRLSDAQSRNQRAAI